MTITGESGSKLIITLLYTFLLAGTGLTQSSDVIYLWPEEVPGSTEPKHEPVQTPDTSRGVTRLTDVTNPSLLVYEPDESLKNGASVIIAPGGGYHILAIDIEGYEIAEWLNKQGITAFILQYRVPQKQEGALMDMQRAVRIVRSNAWQWDLNPEKIGVLGFSAGGSLSARISTRFKEDHYTPVDESDEASARPDFTVLVYPAYLADGEGGSLTPELSVEKKTPPVFMFGTADDPYANRSVLEMSKALTEYQVSYELHVLPEGGHGYGLRKGNVAAETWPDLAEKWLENILKD